MSFKLAALLFLAVCVLARVWRSKVAPLVARVLPASVAVKVNKEVEAVEKLATHELVDALKSRLLADAQVEAKQAAQVEAVAKAKTLLDVSVAPVVEPKPSPKA